MAQAEELGGGPIIGFIYAKASPSCVPSVCSQLSAPGGDSEKQRANAVQAQS